MAGRNSAYPGEAGSYGGGAVRLAPRLALLVVGVVFVGFLVNAFQYVLDSGNTAAHVLPALACLLTMLYLQLAVFSNPNADLHGRCGHIALLVQFGLIVVPLVFYGEAWTGMPGFLAGAALLVLRPLSGWVSFAAVLVGAGLVQAELTHEALETIYIVILSGVTGLIVFGLSWLRSVVKDLDDARSSLAGLAVARERLRFARDLHDLLGFSLSAITLKTELTHRLVPKFPDRARQELTEILDVSRKALADVRAVASSERELSLDEEVISAQSVLDAAEVAVALEVDADQLSAKIRSALATVLREGVTNLLRHSKAAHCRITITANEQHAWIEIVNDGIRGRRGARGHTTADAAGGAVGNGIGNLTARVEALGGQLSAGIDDAADTHRLYVEIPRSADDAPPPIATPDPFDNERSMAPRFAQLLVIAVFAGYALNSILFALNAPISAFDTVVAGTCVMVSFGLVVGFFSRPGATLRSPRGIAALAAQAVLTYLPIMLYDDPVLGLPGFLAGSAMLMLGRSAGVTAFAGIALTIGWVQWLHGGDAVDIGYGLLSTINHGLVVYGLSRLRSMVHVMHNARTELAHLAVTKERLRFARDLHDLLGNSLSYITLKCELIQRLVLRDPDRARQELAGILDVSRKTLSDVRAVARSYRELSLDEETESARALLAAAGVAVTLRLDTSELPQQVRTALASMLHEGVTNLLRHSDAENCEIVLSRHADRLTMEIVNDGVPVKSRPAGGGGIHSLNTRIVSLGGTLTAAKPTDGTYRLRAEIPLD